MKYIFILKNEKIRKYRAVSRLLIFFNLLGFTILLINSEERIATNFWLLISIITTAAYSFFSVIELVSKKSIPDVWHRSIFGYCTIAWLNEGYWWFSVLLGIIILLDILANKKMAVEISDKKITLPSITRNVVDWNELNNVILKDGILTIDFKNNKLFQQLVDETDYSNDEKKFNDFCKSRLTSR